MSSLLPHPEHPQTPHSHLKEARGPQRDQRGTSLACQKLGSNHLIQTFSLTNTCQTFLWARYIATAACRDTSMESLPGYTTRKCCAEAWWLSAAASKGRLLEET